MPPSGAALKIPVSDVTLLADAYGDPADPPIVLLHGGGQTRHSWGATAGDLGSSGWYALTLDLRGHGGSGWSPDHGYSLDRFSDDVVRVVGHLGRPPVLKTKSLMSGTNRLVPYGLFFSPSAVRNRRPLPTAPATVPR
jgi:alpha-beta hydrolase superfamily lysophospholipase